MIERIDIFAELGVHLRSFGKEPHTQRIIDEAIEQNEWFNREDILLAIDAICEEYLDADKLTRWVSEYTAPKRQERVAIIMAGNIPLVGFFDLMCALIAGHEVAVKPSSKDSILTNYIIDTLREISPAVAISDYDPQAEYDKVIATGSNEAARHFSTRYASTPSLVRGSRHSVAILSGNESEQEIAALQRDIFSHNGLGCRSVSLIFLPKDTTLQLAPPAMGAMYRGNYRHCKAMRAMLGQPFADFGECIAVEECAFPANISQINYCYYRSIEDVEQWIIKNDNELQCIVTNLIEHPRRVAFGRAQYPTLWDYADGVDVMKFLTA